MAVGETLRSVSAALGCNYYAEHAALPDDSLSGSAALCCFLFLWLVFYPADGVYFVEKTNFTLFFLVGAEKRCDVQTV